MENVQRLFRSYKRHASRLRDGYKILCEKGNLKVNFQYRQGKAVSCSFDEAQALLRFAALLRPFLAPASPINIVTVLRLLSDSKNMLDSETAQKLNDQLAMCEILGMKFVHNGKELKAKDIYYIYAEGELFDESIQARMLYDKLSVGPMKQFLPFLFYCSCDNYSKFVFILLEAILEIEKRFPELKPQVPEVRRCIYCLSKDGDFGAEEHVIPESLGLDETVLSNCVCKSCNNGFSILDQTLINFGPIAIMRVIGAPLTKKGKYPKAEFQEFTLEKRKPRVLRISSRSQKEVLTEERLDDGFVKLALKPSSTGPINIIYLARALFKIGLGLVAYDKSPEFACEKRYDAAREFIQGRQMIRNHLLMTRSCNNPMHKICTAWNHFETATIVCIEIFGAGFAINLEPTPYDVPADAPKDMFYSFWLGEKADKGIVKPCDDHCNHQ